MCVRVRACALNYRDELMLQGRYNPRQPLPLIPVSDGVGVVEAVGDGVDARLLGARVLGCFCQGWLDGAPSRAALATTLGGPRDGALAEYMLLDAQGVVAAPEALSDVTACTLVCAGLTAWTALVEHGRVHAGETVLVQGSGGVSVFALAIARMHGARVIATTSSAEKAEQLLALGASEVVDRNEHPDWARRVRELVGSDGCDHVIEVGGVGSLAASMKVTRPGGHIALIGILGGSSAQVDLTPALMQGIRIQGTFVGSRAALVRFVRATQQGGLAPVIGAEFGFDEAPAAYAALRSGRHVGKIVIRGA